MSKRNIHLSMTVGNEKCPIEPTYDGPLEKHHIHGHEVPKAEKPWNIVYLSPNTHTLIHNGEIIIEGWFSTSDGKELVWHKKGEESITGSEAKPHQIKRGSTDQKK